MKRDVERCARTLSFVPRIDVGDAGAGKAPTSRYTSQILRGDNARADRVTGSKFLRAQSVAAAAENGHLRIVRNRHTNDFLDELSSFPHGRHDDCVDALSGANPHASKLPRHRLTSSVPKGHIPTQLTARRRYDISSGTDPIEALAARLGARIYDTRNQ